MLRILWHENDVPLNTAGLKITKKLYITYITTDATSTRDLLKKNIPISTVCILRQGAFNLNKRAVSTILLCQQLGYFNMSQSV